MELLKIVLEICFYTYLIGGVSIFLTPASKDVGSEDEEFHDFFHGDKPVTAGDKFRNALRWPATVLAAVFPE